MANLLKEKKVVNGKEYTTLYVEFDSGFVLPVIPCFELTKRQYAAYMSNVDLLPNYQRVVAKVEEQPSIENFKKEGGK